MVYQVAVKIILNALKTYGMEWNMEKIHEARLWKCFWQRRQTLISILFLKEKTPNRDLPNDITMERFNTNKHKSHANKLLWVYNNTKYLDYNCSGKCFPQSTGSCGSSPASVTKQTWSASHDIITHWAQDQSTWSVSAAASHSDGAHLITDEHSRPDQPRAAVDQWVHGAFSSNWKIRGFTPSVWSLYKITRICRFAVVVTLEKGSSPEKKKIDLNNVYSGGRVFH